MRTVRLGLLASLANNSKVYFSREGKGGVVTRKGGVRTPKSPPPLDTLLAADSDKLGVPSKPLESFSLSECR